MATQAPSQYSPNFRLDYRAGFAEKLYRKLFELEFTWPWFNQNIF